MSYHYAKLDVSKEMRNKMAKPRMNKEEKAFMEQITKFVFATPEIRNGVRYLDRKTFHLLSQDTQDRYIHLMIHKTR